MNSMPSTISQKMSSMRGSVLLNNVFTTMSPCCCSEENTVSPNNGSSVHVINCLYHYYECIYWLFIYVWSWYLLYKMERHLLVYLMYLRVPVRPVLNPKLIKKKNQHKGHELLTIQCVPHADGSLFSWKSPTLDPPPTTTTAIAVILPSTGA